MLLTWSCCTYSGVGELPMLLWPDNFCSSTVFSVTSLQNLIRSIKFYFPFDWGFGRSWFCYYYFHYSCFGFGWLLHFLVACGLATHVFIWLASLLACGRRIYSLSRGHGLDASATLGCRLGMISRLLLPTLDVSSASDYFMLIYAN